jgi:tetratricopeptide (TPR) repeat protein
LQEAIRLDKTNSEAYYWLGELYLLQGENETAVANFEKSVQYNAGSFRNAEGLARAYLAIKEYGQAYITIGRVEKLADTDEKRAKFLYIGAIANENLSAPSAAVKQWNELLSLPEEAVSPEMRAEALKHLEALRTPTAVPPTLTITNTTGPQLSPTPSKTPVPQATRQPSKTPVPSNTRAPTVTPTVTPTP